MNTIVKLSVVDQPATLVTNGNAAFFGDEPFTLVCGQCGFLIGRDISITRLRQLMSPPPVIECFQCKAHNALP